MFNKYKKYLLNSKTFLSFWIIIILAAQLNIIAQEEDDSCLIKRQQFFLQSRTFNGRDSIPYSAFFQAVKQNCSQGFYINNQIPWTSLGPRLVDGAYSGRPGFVKYDPRKPSIIYVGGANGGIWKSSDGGNSWVPKTDNLPTLTCGALAIDTISGTIYYGSGDACWFFEAYPGNGIYTSNDYGETWSSINATGLPNQTQFYNLLIDPVNNNILYAALDQGFYRSSDYGQSWSCVIGNGAQVCSGIAVSQPSGQSSYVYAIGPTNNCKTPGIGYWKSSDGGTNFVPMTSAGFPDHSLNDTAQISNIATSQSDPSVVYILSQYNIYKPTLCIGGSYIYKSTDYGEHFNIINGGNAFECSGTMANYANVLEVSPYTSTEVYVAIGYSYLSRDGSTFSKLAGTHIDQHCQDFYPNWENEGRFFIGNDGGVFETTDYGNSWTQKNNNLELSMCYGLGGNLTDPYKLVTGLQDEGVANLVNQSQDQWNVIDAGDGGSEFFSETNYSTVLFNVANFYGILYSNNNGNSYMGSNSSSYWGNYGWLIKVASHPTQPGVFYTFTAGSDPSGTTFYIFKSTDNGVNWSNGTNAFSTISDNQYLYHCYPQSITICESNPNILYFTAYPTDWPVPPNEHSVAFESSDGGITWGKVARGGDNGIPDKFFNTLVPDPYNTDEALLTLSGYGNGHVFRTVDGGSNWSDISGNLDPNIPATDVIIHYTDCNTKEYILGTDAGVYRTDANSISWQKYATGLPNSLDMKLVYFPLSNLLRVATYGRGVWEIPLQTTGGQQTPFVIKDNYYIWSSANINTNIIICSGGVLHIPNSCTLQFASGTGITVENGGQIDASSGNAITLTSQSGTWAGITFQYGGYGTLNNCNFQNAPTSINIDYTGNGDLGGGGGNSPGGNPFIEIDYCQFSNESITATNLNTVETFIEYNQFSGCDAVNTGSAIHLVSSSSAYIMWNTISITGAYDGIEESNSNCYIKQNPITGDNSGQYGISIDNSSSPLCNLNTISGFGIGLYVINSSPSFYYNSVNTNTSTDVPLSVNVYSVPILRPLYSTDGGIVWLAGVNTLGTSNSPGDYSIKINDKSGIPKIDGGVNFINANSYYIYGSLSASSYSIDSNCWNGGDPNPLQKIYLPNVSNLIFTTTICQPPFSGLLVPSGTEPDNLYLAGGENSNCQGSFPNPDLDPLTPYIIDLGFGHYDTIKVTGLAPKKQTHR